MRGRAVDLGGPAWREPVVRRKVALLQAVGAACGRPVRTDTSAREVDERARSAFAARSTTALRPWHRAELCAVVALGGWPGLTDEAVSDLAALADERGAFHLPMATAAALLALHRVGARAQRDACLDAVLAAQRPDGSWPFTTNELWDTSLVLRSFGDALPSALVASARAFLSAGQQADGGFGFRVGAQSDNDTTASVLAALGADPAHAAARRRAVAFLASQRRPDGSWRTWQDDTDDVSEDVLAHVITALDRCPEATLELEPSRAWLRARWGAGGWSGTWYRNAPYVVNEVTAALAVDDPVAVEATERLARTQNPDGGFGADPSGPSLASATGLAVACLARSGRHRGRVERAAAWLAAAQRPDGSFAGVPEMLGPRPLVAHYQTQTHALAGGGLAAGAP